MRDRLLAASRRVWPGGLALAAVFALSSCVTPPVPVCYNAQIHTIDNEQINLCDFKIYEKNHHLERTVFQARWRESLDLVTIPFDDIASARKIGRFDTRVRFRDGTEDDFSEFFIDEYVLKGWSEYGPFQINATLVRGVVFVDADGNPVGGEEAGYIPPLIPPPEEEDRFVTFEGDVISGRLAASEFTIRTAYGTLTLDRDLINEIMVDREAEVMQQVVKLKNDDIISGFLEPTQVKMVLPGGQPVTLDIDQLNRIRFSRPVATEESEER
jgi:hypothetical protein